MEKINKFKRLSKTRIDFSGPDTLRFLGGMWSCDLARAAKAAQEGNPASCRGLLLDQKGKLVSWGSFLVFSPEKVQLFLEKQLLAPTIEALDRYLIADQVEMLPAKEEQEVRLLFSETELFGQAEQIPATSPNALDRVWKGKTLATDSGAKDSGAKDSENSLRLMCRADLGLDVAEAVGDGPALAKLVEEQANTEMSDREFTAFRLQRRAIQWGEDLKLGELVLEAPHREEISFYKGCYLGQEVVARGTFRGTMPRKLYWVSFPSELSAEFKDAYFYSKEDSEKKIGQLRSFQAQEAFALIRGKGIQAHQLLLRSDSGKELNLEKLEEL